MTINQFKERIIQREGRILSTDTLRMEDLLMSAYEILTDVLDEPNRLIDDIRESFTEEPDRYNVYHSYTKFKTGAAEQAPELWNDICEYFNQIAPDGYYFGSTEGDGACIGWFKIEEEI